jgi:hypothetical protein
MAPSGGVASPVQVITNIPSTEAEDKLLPEIRAVFIEEEDRATGSSAVSIGLFELGPHSVEYDEDLVTRLETLGDPTPDVSCEEDDDL